MITAEQLSHLQKLANISLDSFQEQKFVDDLWSVISELEKLQNISLSSTISSWDISMPTRWSISEVTDSQDLLGNISHPLINNSPVIKSILDS